MMPRLTIERTSNSQYVIHVESGPLRDSVCAIPDLEQALAQVAYGLGHPGLLVSISESDAQPPVRDEK